MIEANFLIKFWDKKENFLNDNDYARYGYAWDTYGINVNYNGNFYDYDLMHPSFDPQIECRVLEAYREEKACCGSFPNVVRYRPKNGMFGCCNGKTYNSLVHSCCGSGSLAELGDIGC